MEKVIKKIFKALKKNLTITVEYDLISNKIKLSIKLSNSS